LSETRRGSKAREDYIAQIAQVRGKISETELQILQLDQDFQTEVLKDLEVKSPN
jgi:membrane fusion protein, type I secretion system